jgi:PAS domain S-box-containing protein
MNAGPWAQAGAGLLFWWPKHLRHQMLLLLAGVTVLSMLALHLLSGQRAAKASFETSRHWAQAVASTAASSGAQAMVLKDYAQLETTLRDIARLPGVLRIDVADADGKALLSLQTQTSGQAIVRYRPSDVRIPTTLAGGVEVAPEPISVDVDGRMALQVWTPVDSTAPLGSIGVLFSQEAERKAMGQILRDSLWVAAAAGAATILVVYGFLLRALNPLQRLAKFSQLLGSDSGQTLQQRTGSQEVEDLTDALNDASVRLMTQMEALRRNEAKTHAILDATPDAILGLDEHCRITLINPAATSIFGVQPEDIDGARLQTLLPQLDAKTVEELTLQGTLNHASQSRMTRLDSEAKRRDGTPFPVEVAISRVQTPEGFRYTCVVSDVTDQRWMDSMLRLYSRALECTANGVVISDVRSPGQPLFYANPAFEKITGYATFEAIGRNCSFLQGTDTEQNEIAVLRDAVKRGESATVVLRNYKKDGSLFFNELSIAPVAEPDGTVTHYVGIQSDVTERERARFALAERNARLNAVFDLSPDGFVVFDRDRQLVYCNPAFMQMTGWTDVAAVSELDLPRFDAQMQALCDPGQPYVPVVGATSTSAAGDTLTLIHPERKILSRVVRLNMDGQGESVFYFRDVTRETEVDRMKSEFLTTAAHELRTPMVSIFGFAELMLKRPVPPERQRDVIETIHRQSSLLINMINELLDLARIEARQGKDFRMKPQPVQSLIDDAVAVMTVRKESHPVVVDCEHGDMVLMLDNDKSRQALGNVLSNAYKYSPQGGQIKVSTRLLRSGAEAKLGIAVSDQGIGMTPEQQNRLFERFFRADPSGNIPGTGLGMCLVKEIMGLHGGGVQVQSQIGLGTTVTLWFPLSEQTLTRPMTLS